MCVCGGAASHVIGEVESIYTLGLISKFRVKSENKLPEQGVLGLMPGICEWLRGARKETRSWLLYTDFLPV